MKLETICFTEELPFEPMTDQEADLQDRLSSRFNQWVQKMNIVPNDMLGSETTVLSNTVSLRIIYQCDTPNPVKN